MKEKFSLVMLAERMDESLVLLAHRLCLPLYMMAGLNLNARKEKVLMLQTERQVLYQMQQVDLAVYNHFGSKFQEHVEEFGVQKMQRSVNELRRINHQVSHTRKH